MKFLLLALLVTFSTNSFSYEIINQKEKVEKVIDAFKLLGVEVQILSHSSLDYNSGTNLPNIGSFSILRHTNISKNKFDCFIEYNSRKESKFISQKEFAELIGFDARQCLNNNLEECFVSFIPIKLNNIFDSAFMAANSNIPPGSIVKCNSIKNKENTFSMTFIY